MVVNENNPKIWASLIAPNPDDVTYWVDLTADPHGNIIKFYDNNDEEWYNLTSPTSDYAVYPYIGPNGNWFIENRDSGVRAQGEVPNATINGHRIADNPVLTKEDIGLGNVANLAPEDYPVPDAVYGLIDGKVDETRTINGHTLDADVVITKSDIGLGNVENVAPADMPVSTATATALSGKADTTRNIVAGSGLVGGGNLTADRTINIVSATDGITVNADNIQLNTNNTLTSTSTTQALSAAQGKVLNDKNIEQDAALLERPIMIDPTGDVITPSLGAYSKDEADAKFVAKTQIVQTEGTSTTNVMSQKAVTDELNALETDLNQLNGKTFAIKCFSRYDKSIDEFYDFNTRPNIVTNRSEVYAAIKQLQLFGFDKSIPHRLGFFWINRLGSTSPVYRFIIQKWDGLAWVNVCDLSTTTPNIISNVWYIDYTYQTFRMVSVVDLKNLPTEIDGTIESSSTSSSYIISEACFDTSVYNQLYQSAEQTIKTVKSRDLIVKSIEADTLSLKNETLFPCFARNMLDISSLNNEMFVGYKRKLKYQAFKGLKMYGFDKSKKYSLSALWVDSYSSSHYYRIIINEWNGSSWVSSFDSGNLSKSTLGIVDGSIYTWDQTVGSKRIIANIDYSNLRGNDSTILNSGEPELIINPSCIHDQELSKTANVEFNTLKLAGEPVSPLLIQNISGVKPYYNSRRKPTFAFIWDDLNTTDALVFSIFQEYGFLPSFALISNNLNANNATEYQNYYMKGCTILAHSISHPSMSNPATITYEEVDNQMKTSKKIIESYGMRVSGWVTPQSSLDISFFPLMVKNFGYGFTGLNGGLFNSTVDPLKMSRYGIESAMANHNRTTIINRIDSAIANNELVVFYGHRLPSTYLNGDSTPYVTEDDLRFVLDYLKTKTDENLCQVLSCDEAIYQYYKQPFA